MKVEINNRDFIIYLILFLIIVLIVMLFFKMDNLRFEAQVKINTQSIINIDAYLQQQQQMQIEAQQKANAPVFELAPKKKPDKK